MAGRSPLHGYNTNYRKDELVFHVQTEDLGEPAAAIVTQVFSGGTILAKERTEYKDIAGTEGLEPELRARMQRQHKKLLLALRDGKIDTSLVTAPPAAAGSAQPERSPSLKIPGLPEGVDLRDTVQMVLPPEFYEELDIESADDALIIEDYPPPAKPAPQVERPVTASEKAVPPPPPPPPPPHEKVVLPPVPKQPPTAPPAARSPSSATPAAKSQPPAATKSQPPAATKSQPPPPLKIAAPPTGSKLSPKATQHASPPPPPARFSPPPPPPPPPPPVPPEARVSKSKPPPQRPSAVSKAPSVPPPEGRRPRIFAEVSRPERSHAEEQLGERSLDEVILSYLADELQED